MVILDCDMAKRFTAESVRIVVFGDRIFLRSQTLTVLSSLPETIMSTPANTALVTGLKLKILRNALKNAYTSFCFKRSQPVPPQAVQRAKNASFGTKVSIQYFDDRISH